MIRGVIFDMDNTLVYPALDFNFILNNVRTFLLESGLSYGEIGPLSPLLESIEAMKDRWPEIYTGAMEVLVNSEIERARTSFIPHSVFETLETLKKMDIRMAVITRNCRRATEIAIDPIKEYFIAIITREDVKYPKPHPEHILSGVRALGLKPSSCLCVGDYEFDIIAGRKAGCVTAGIGIDGDYTVDSIAEIPGIITEINTR